MPKKESKWVVYEFRDGRPVLLSKPHTSREAAEKLREKLIVTLGKRALGVGRLS